MYQVKEFYEKYKELLALSIVAGDNGLSKTIRVPEAQRPGLSLSGYLKNYVNQRVLVLGTLEVSYLRDLDAKTRLERVQGILTPKTPLVVIAGRYAPPQEIMSFCEENSLPLLRTKMKTMDCVNSRRFFHWKKRSSSWHD